MRRCGWRRAIGTGWSTLCRYAGRPAIAESRLSLLRDGRVLYSLKKRWKDGSTSVVIEPQVLMERLCALVPRPRRHLVTYHGVLAPAAGIRPWVVPRVEAEEDGGCRHEGAAAHDDEPGIGNDAADDDAVRRLLRHRTVPHRPGKSRRGGRRYPWTELLRRVYMADVLLCRHCGGKRPREPPFPLVGAASILGSSSLLRPMTNALTHAASSLLAFLAAASGLAAQCANTWVAANRLRGTNGEVFASTPWDPDGAGPATELSIVGGSFTSAGDVNAAGIAAWDPATGAWSALGSGIGGGYVASLAVLPSGDLVAAGSFNTAGGVPASKIARWDGVAWSPLGAGLDQDVRTLSTLPNGDLIAGGLFATAGGVGANRVARWDGVSWSALGTGMAGSSSVDALLALPNGDLIAGGFFATAGGVAANNVARWNGTSWSAMSGGVGTSPTAQVMSLLLLSNGDVMAGGNFPAPGGLAVQSIAIWNGTSWSLPSTPMNGYCRALAAMPNGDVVAVGQMWWLPLQQNRHAVRWNGTTWTPLGTGFDTFARTVHVLSTGDVIAGGTFLLADGISARSVARWNGTSWSSLSAGWDGPPSVAVEAPNGDLYVAGAFRSADGVAANYVARFDGSTWSPLGAGVSAPVSAMLQLPNGDLIVGGSFLTAGVIVRSVARWNGTSWSAIGSGMNTGSSIYALARLPNGDLVAGGWFAAGPLSGNIVRWDGTTWLPMGSGIVGRVYALTTLPNGDLVAAGQFTSAGGILANNIARWNGTAWSAMGTGTNARVGAMALLPNGDLVVGGFFSTAGGIAANGVARWNGAVWSPMGAGLQIDVFALASLPNGDVLAGGLISLPGNPYHRVLRWDGTSWSNANGIGADFLGGEPSRFLALPGGDLLVTGAFTSVGGMPSPYLVRLSTTCPATATTHGLGCPGAGGNSVLAADGPPWLGSTWRATGTGLPPTALVITLTSVASLPQGFAPLTLVFPQAGAGCDVLVVPDILGLGLTTTGTAQSSLFLPNTPAFVGLTFYHQMVPIEVDALGAWISVTATNSLQLTTGMF